MTDTIGASIVLHPKPRTADRSWLRATWMQPAMLMATLSIVFGSLTILINPPLRGPDEPAHFVRVYAYTQGIIKPPREREGRKGIELPGELRADFAFFNARRGKIWDDGFTFHQASDEYRAHRAKQTELGGGESGFELFEGSEGYSPVPYAPHIVMGVVAQVFGLDFATTLYLMRFAGLAAFTAIAAYAIAMTPHLKWAFVLIAMLPASLYGRTVIGADAAVNSLALLVAALSLRAASGILPDRPLERMLWMTLCVLSKPPQIAFVLFEPMVHRFRALSGRWRTVALVVLPGIILSPLWMWFIDAEMAVWRVMADGKYPPEYFDIGWKLRFMIEHPLHFPSVMIHTIVSEAGTLGMQLIGILGWLDTELHPSVYVLLGLALLMTAFERMTVDSATRYRIALYTGAVTASYVVLVFLILFLTWTPPVVPEVWGIQGRYFIPVLAPAALFLSALVNRQLPPEPLRWTAIAASVLGSTAMLEAIWRVNWVA